MHLGTNKQNQMQYYDGQGYDGLVTPNEFESLGAIDFDKVFSTVVDTAKGIYTAKNDIAIQKLNFKRQQAYMLQQQQAGFQSFAPQNPIANAGVNYLQAPYYPQPSQNTPFNIQPYIPLMLGAGALLLLITVLNNRNK